MRKTRTLMLALCLTLCACSGDDGDDGERPSADAQTLELQRQVLDDASTQVIAPTYREFADRAATLEDAAASWADTDGEAEREAAQQAWRDAMATWQRAEVYQVGPASVMGQVVGGDDLRDQIYSWPLTNPCRIDQEIVARGYEDRDALADELINVRGLDALEYLLFYEGADNACAPNSSINSQGTWDELPPEELTARRAGFAAALAVLLRERADELVAAWEGDDGFGATLSSAGDDDNATFPTTREGLNALSDAMFYIEKETKDMKLADPVGFGDCGEDVCPGELEHPFSHTSKASALANLRGFQALYLGAPPEQDGQGFDDLLVQAGAAELDAQIQDQIEAAIAALEALEGSFHQALTDDPEAAVAAYQETQALTTLLKTQFVSTLDLELPQRAEGDND